MIFLQITQQLNTIRQLILEITDEQYTKPIKHLSNSSIGGHTRHVIELLQCAIRGYQTGEIDYINRARDLQLENNKSFAIATLQSLCELILLPDKQLKIVVDDTNGNSNLSTITTTFYREVVYNMEHAIHHLALIKVALLEMKIDIASQDIGMAYSTIKYNASLKPAKNKI